MEIRKDLLNNLEGNEPLSGEEKLNDTPKEVTGTSPVAGNEPEPVELNNSTIPTEKEEIAAGFEATPEAEVEQETEPVPTDVNDSEVEVTEEQAVVEETNPEPEMQEEDGVFSGQATQTFTQSQVDEIAGKTRKETREKTLRSVYARYGVNSEEELDDLFGNAQRYDTLKEQYDTDKSSWKQADEERNATLSNLSEQVALLQSGIDKNRYDDAKFILKGKGLEVTLENIEAELATHPEWKSEPVLAPDGNPNPHFVKKQAPVGTMPQAPAHEQNPTKISVLGNNGMDTPTPELSERDIALKKIFKV